MNGPNIVARLGLDPGDFAKGLEKARRDASEYAGKVGAILGTAIGAGAISEAMEYAKEIDNISRKFGLSAESVQEWNKAAKLAGRTVDEVSDSWENLTEAIVKANAGDEDMAASFEKLGVAADTLKSKNLDAILREMAGGSKEASIMFDIVGENAIKLIPALTQLERIAGDVGGTMSQETVNGLVDLQRQLEQIKTTLLSGVGGAVVWLHDRWQDFAAYLAGSWIDTVDGIKEGGNAIELALKGNFEEAAKAAKKAFSTMKGGAGVLGAAQDNAERAAARAQRPGGGSDGFNVDADGDADSSKGKGKGGDGRNEGQRFADAANKIQGINQQIENSQGTPREQLQKQLDAERQRVKDLRDRLNTPSLSPVEREEAKAELAEAGLNAKQAKDKLRDQFIADQLAGPDGRRQSKRDQQEWDRLDRRFEREQQLRDRGGMSQVDFDRQQRMKRARDPGEFLGPEMPANMKPQKVTFSPETLNALEKLINKIEIVNSKE